MPTFCFSGKGIYIYIAAKKKDISFQLSTRHYLQLTNMMMMYIIIYSKVCYLPTKEYSFLCKNIKRQYYLLDFSFTLPMMLAAPRQLYYSRFSTPECWAA